MPGRLLSTKLHITQTTLELVPRPHLDERLGEGFRGKLTLISAPAGFGKTTPACEWVAAYGQLEPKVCFARLSRDEGDNDPTPFPDLPYLCLADACPERGRTSRRWHYYHLAGILRVQGFINLGNRRKVGQQWLSTRKTQPKDVDFLSS